MTIIYRQDKGSELTYAEMDGNFLDLDARMSKEDKCRMGWWDYNDVTTASSPIAITGGSTWYQITNDGAGAQTNSTYVLDGTAEVWNTSTNQFDFSDIPLGSVVRCRFAFNLTTTANSQEVDFRMRFGVGSTPYNVGVGNLYRKAIGSYDDLSLDFTFYIGNSLTRDNPAELQVNSANNASLEVQGLFITVLARGEVV